ncbi:MAG TPA: alkaline phosphatase family protein [Candidatus Bathyarchaeia archaeon]|nr:alkaline phosphatase family protein [Candidatus Bathyarchaeia archaeon]
MSVLKSLTATVAAAAMLVSPLITAAQQRSSGIIQGTNIKHVLLISVDGMHALDLTNYVASHPNSALAYLKSTGVTYDNASTSDPSDSFPGLAALVTGATPSVGGLWYDDTYNRNLIAPASSGLQCPGTAGTEVNLSEFLDFDSSKLDAGGGINPANLPRDPNTCAAIYPHQYIRVNTIFNVAKNAGMYTAWTDKHPAYEWVKGPTADGVNDFFAPEVNSLAINLPGITTPTFGTCNPLPDTPSTGDDWTKSTKNIQCYDQIKVNATLNQIDGKTSDGSKSAPVPAIFGMNFQAVSVGQKLKSGGYTDALGTPSARLAEDLDFVDDSLGAMINEINKQGLWPNTMIIVAAKHGQSPIQRSKKTAIDPAQIPGIVGSSYAFDISDDASLIWLNDQKQTGSVVATLSQPSNQATLGIQEIFALNSLKTKFGDPAKDDHVPDILLKVNTGVVFTTGSKIAEHGGDNEDDVHTVLIVARKGTLPIETKTPVTNYQVAPSIVRVLGLNLNNLDAYKYQNVQPLPLAPLQ